MAAMLCTSLDGETWGRCDENRTVVDGLKTPPASPAVVRGTADTLSVRQDRIALQLVHGILGGRLDDGPACCIDG